MTDLDDAASKLATKATLRAARDAASKALEDALLTDEERAQRKAADAAAAKRKRQKLIVLGVVGLFLVLGIVGFVVHFWHWFLLAGLLGLAALYGRHRWRKRRSQKPSAPRKVAPPVARVAIESAATADDSDVEDELRALKARVKR